MDQILDVATVAGSFAAAERERVERRSAAAQLRADASVWSAAAVVVDGLIGDMPVMSFEEDRGAMQACEILVERFRNHARRLNEAADLIESGGQLQ